MQKKKKKVQGRGDIFTDYKIYQIVRNKLINYLEGNMTILGINYTLLRHSSRVLRLQKMYTNSITK